MKEGHVDFFPSPSTNKPSNQKEELHLINKVSGGCFSPYTTGGFCWRGKSVVPTDFESGLEIWHKEGHPLRSVKWGHTAPYPQPTKALASGRQLAPGMGQLPSWMGRFAVRVDPLFLVTVGGLCPVTVRTLWLCDRAWGVPVSLGNHWVWFQRLEPILCAACAPECFGCTGTVGMLFTLTERGWYYEYASWCNHTSPSWQRISSKPNLAITLDFCPTLENWLLPGPTQQTPLLSIERAGTPLRHPSTFQRSKPSEEKNKQVFYRYVKINVEIQETWTRKTI